MTDYSFSEAVLAAVSAETRKTMEVFAHSIVTAENALRAYHSNISAAFTGNVDDPLMEIRQRARLVYTMTWTKAILFSRSIVQCVNDGNLLVAFQALRSYVELVAALRYSVKRIARLRRSPRRVP
jgi:hypothetical protein